MPHEPKKKHSKSQKRIRRASIRLGAISFIICKNCNAKTLGHMACRSCGFYDGKNITGTKTKAVVTRV